MYTKIRSFFTALAVVSLLASSSFAGTLATTPGAFDDGSMVWQGSVAYDNTLGLNGTIDYVVMTAANFAANFPTAGTPASGTTLSPSGYTAGDDLVYLYQVNNAGGFSVSAQIVGIDNPANTIGEFRETASDIESSLYGFDIGGNAIWNFSVPFIAGGQSSTILAFSSPNVPEFGASITVNGGTLAFSSVPTPSATPIPEPASIAMLALGTMFVATRRRK